MRYVISAALVATPSCGGNEDAESSSGTLEGIDILCERWFENKSSSPPPNSIFSERTSTDMMKSSVVCLKIRLDYYYYSTRDRFLERKSIAWKVHQCSRQFLHLPLSIQIQVLGGEKLNFSTYSDLTKLSVQLNLSGRRLRIRAKHPEFLQFGNLRNFNLYLNSLKTCQIELITATRLGQRNLNENSAKTHGSLLVCRYLGSFIESLT